MKKATIKSKIIPAVLICMFFLTNLDIFNIGVFPAIIIPLFALFVKSCRKRNIIFFLFSLLYSFLMFAVSMMITESSFFFIAIPFITKALLFAVYAVFSFSGFDNFNLIKKIMVISITVLTAAGNIAGSIIASDSYGIAFSSKILTPGFIIGKVGFIAYLTGIAIFVFTNKFTEPFRKNPNKKESAFAELDKLYEEEKLTE